MIRPDKLLKNDSIFSLQISMDLSIAAASPKWDSSFKGLANQIVGQNLKKILIPLSFSKFENLINRLLTTESQIDQLEVCLSTSEQYDIWMDWLIFRDQDMIYAVCKDITHLKEAMNKVELIERNLKVGTWSIDNRTGTGHWSAEASSIHGESNPKEMDVSTGVNYFLPQYQSSISNEVENSLNTGKPLNFEGQIKRTDGEVRWVRSIGEPSYQKGKLHGLIGTIQDIQQEKLTQIELKASLERFDQILENFPGIFYVFYMKPNGDTGFSYIAENAKRVYGYEPSDIIANPDLIFRSVHPNDSEDLHSAIANSAAHMCAFRWTGRFVSGPKISWIRAISSPKLLDCGTIEWTGIFIDETKQKECEQLIESQQKQLFTSRKFSHLGELAGGIAHEINTPLNTLGLTVDYIRNLEKASKLSSEKLAEQLERIENVISRVSKTVDTIRSFSRNENLEENTNCPINEIIDECNSLLEDKMQFEGISFTSMTDSNHFVLCKRNQILQVLLNLVSNAIYACEKNSPEKKWINIQCLRDGDSAIIRVVDGGNGINPEIRERIFDSFFTTKPYGEGTGLGLSLASEFVKASGGTLLINNESKNTCFEVRLTATQRSELAS